MPIEREIVFCLFVIINVAIHVIDIDTQHNIYIQYIRFTRIR